MSLFWTLLKKDLLRVGRNPAPILILLGIPMAISAMIGFVFSSGGSDEGMNVAPIRLGVIDEDDSIFSQFLGGASGSEDMSDRIELTSLEDEEMAIEMIQDGELSAVLIITEGFTSSFLQGEDDLKLELIKNPAEYIYPTLAQEGGEVIVTALNALLRNFDKDLRELHGLLEEDRDFDFFRDALAVTTLLERARNRLDAAEIYLNPPLVNYNKPDETTEEETESTADTNAVEVDETEVVTDSGTEFNLFKYLLIGMAAMFMLMIGDNCMRDLYRENRFRTFERFRTLQESLWLFIAVKVLFTVIVLVIAVTILLGVGSLAFGYGWNAFGETILLVCCYSFFGAGFMGLIAAIAGRERRADMLNTMIVMVLSVVGGAMWPPEQLPPFVKNFLTPYSPVYWFSEQVRLLQMDPEKAQWLLYSALMVGLGILMISGASIVFKIRLEKGIRES